MAGTSWGLIGFDAFTLYGSEDNIEKTGYKVRQDITTNQDVQTNRFAGLWGFVAIVTFTLVLFFVSEFICWILLEDGDRQPYLFNISPDVSPGQGQISIFSPDSYVFNSVDPHLGYGHRYDDAPEETRPKIPHQWIEGDMIVYFTDEAMDLASTPLIVILGGSTTDALMYESSWPEELAKLLREHSANILVANGGVGGYSSSQELLKLLRDVLPLRPKLVISYNGINDMGDWYMENHAMVHPYQRSLFASMLGLEAVPRIMPNTVTLFRELFGLSPALGVNWGTPSNIHPGEIWMQNVELMGLITDYAGIDFLHVIQPVGGIGSFEIPDSVIDQKGEDYFKILNETYDFAFRRKHSFRLDLTDLFAKFAYSFDEIYLKDARHLTVLGNKLIADAIFDAFFERDLVSLKFLNKKERKIIERKN